MKEGADRGERTFTLGDAIEFLQTREKVIERKLNQGGLSPDTRQQLRQILGVTRWEILKAEIILNRKGVVNCES